MNLWIRSQDKMALVKINSTIGLKYGDLKTIIANYQPDFTDKYDGYYDVLGTYATKERALEVIDEIQNIFSLTIKDSSYQEADLLLKAKMLDIVYQMPEE